MTGVDEQIGIHIRRVDIGRQRIAPEHSISQIRGLLGAQQAVHTLYWQVFIVFVGLPELVGHHIELPVRPGDGGIVFRIPADDVERMMDEEWQVVNVSCDVGTARHPMLLFGGEELRGRRIFF